MLRIESEKTDIPVREELQAQYEQYRLLLERASDVIYSVDGDFRLSYISPSVEKHLGYMPQELTGKLFSELGLLTEESLARAIEDTMRIIKGEVLEEAEYDFIARDGTMKRAQIRSTVIRSKGRITSIVSVARDVTAQRDAERARAASEQRFKSMAEKITDGVIIVEEGRVVYVNDRVCTLCGYPREELVQLWGPDLTAPQSADQKKQIMQKVRDTGVYPEQLDVWITRKDGAQCCLNLRFAFSYSCNNMQSGYVLITDVTEAMREREKMQDTMEFLDNSIGKAVDAIVITEAEGMLKRVNQSFLQLTGYDEEEVIGKHVTEFSAVMEEEYETTTGEHIRMGQDYMDYTLRMSEQLLDQKKIVDWESYLVRKDGRAVPIAMSITYVFDKKGAVSGCVGILRDNTERNIAERELRETRDFLANVIQSSLDPIVIGDKLGNITGVNKSLVQLIGFEQEELVGKHMAAMLPPQAGFYASTGGTTVLLEESFYERAYAQMKTLIEQGKLSACESYYFAKNGKIVPVEQTMFYIYDKQGDRIAVVTITRDISERKKSEQAIVDVRNFLEDIIRTSADGIVVTDTMGTITLVNDAVTRILGYSKEELLGINAHDLMSISCDNRQNEFKMTSANSMDSIFCYEGKWTAKGGQLIDLEMSIGILKDARNCITGMVACLRDITDRMAAEKKLLDYQNQLRCMASQLTLTEEQERKRIALEIHDNVTQSLALAKIKLGAMSAAKAPRERAREIRAIRALLEQCIGDTRTLIFNLSPPFLYEFGLEKALEWLLEDVGKQHGIRTRLEYHDAEGSFDDDVRILLYQSIRELLINVVKHAHAKTAAVFLDMNAQMVHVSVEDDGIGFVVDPDGVNISSRGGYGIFSIRERFQYLGGVLTIDSKPNRGTRIAMELPIMQH